MSRETVILGQVHGCQRPVRRRWRQCCCFCASLAFALAALEWSVFRKQDWTLHIVLYTGVACLVGLTLAWAAKAVRKVLAFYGACMLALCLVEAGLRLNPNLEPLRSSRHDFLFQFDARLGWRFVAGAEKVVEERGQYQSRVKINAAGFRDREPDPQDHAPVLAFLGDSFVTNFGVADDEVFTELVRRDVAPRLSVRNCSVNGYGQVQELLLLDEILETYKPTMTLVVVYTRNDFDDNLGDFDWNLGYHRPQCQLGPDGKIVIVNRLHEPKQKPESAGLLSFLDDTIHELRVRQLLRQTIARIHPESQPMHFRPPELHYCKCNLDPREQKALELTKALLREMKQKCDCYQCRFGVVIAPSLWQVEQSRWDRLLAEHHVDARDYDRTVPNRLLTDFCAAEGYPSLDLLPALTACADSGECLYYPKEQHWNRLGNMRVAQAISAWLTGLHIESPQSSAPIGEDDLLLRKQSPNPIARNPRE